jgi:hypothetical protein
VLGRLSLLWWLWSGGLLKFGGVGLCISAFGEAAEVVVRGCCEWMFGVFVVVKVIQVVVDPVFGSQIAEQICPLRRYRRSVRDVDVESRVLKVRCGEGPCLTMLVMLSISCSQSVMAYILRIGLAIVRRCRLVS